MTLKEMKRKADCVYKKNRKPILSEFFLVGYVSLLAQYLRDGFFSFFVSLFLFPITHGYVKHCIHLIDDENPVLSYKDSLVGILEFPRVAPVYLVEKALVTIVTGIFAFPLFVEVGKVVPEFSWELISELGNVLIQSEFLVPHVQELMTILMDTAMLFQIGICVLVYLLMSAFLMCVPYVMELEDYSWSESFTLSTKMMRGHMLQYFHMCLSFTWRYVSYWLITGVLLITIGSFNEFCMLFCLVLSLFLYIDIFRARFELVKYLFYKDIREDYKKHKNEDEHA